MITNFRDSEGDSPNTAFDYETSRLTKRFFMVDTISGITDSGGFFVDARPKFVRLASATKLTVQLDPNADERILRPMLQITYIEREVSVIEDST
jgi:hypothetical protein